MCIKFDFLWLQTFGPHFLLLNASRYTWNRTTNVILLHIALSTFRPYWCQLNNILKLALAQAFLNISYCHIKFYLVIPHRFKFSKMEPRFKSFKAVIDTLSPFHYCQPFNPQNSLDTFSLGNYGHTFLLKTQHLKPNNCCVYPSVKRPRNLTTHCLAVDNFFRLSSALIIVN